MHRTTSRGLPQHLPVRAHVQARAALAEDVGTLEMMPGLLWLAVAVRLMRACQLGFEGRPYGGTDSDPPSVHRVTARWVIPIDSIVRPLSSREQPKVLGLTMVPHGLEYPSEVDLRMLRRLVLCTVTLLFVLQGALQASAPLGGTEPPAQHDCDGHENATEDCPCCPDGVPSNNSCMSVCLAMSALPVSAVIFEPADAAERTLIEISGPIGPSYLPFKPPPIA